MNARAILNVYVGHIFSRRALLTHCYRRSDVVEVAGPADAPSAGGQATAQLTTCRGIDTPEIWWHIATHRILQNIPSWWMDLHLVL